MSWDVFAAHTLTSGFLQQGLTGSYCESIGFEN